ncbi:unnamed protein product [Closterium sp. NIES-64]|nr:unnamed protein product [Closterium sp. NIES-64]
MASVALPDAAHPDRSSPSHCLPDASPPHVAATPAAPADSATPTASSRRSDPSATCARLSRKERRRTAKKARRQQQRRERAIAAAESLAREEEERERRAEASSAERWARIEEERRRREAEDEERRAREEGERRWLAREREIEEEKKRVEERRRWTEVSQGCSKGSDVLRREGGGRAEEGRQEAAAAAAAAVAGAVAAGREDKRACSQQTKEEDEKTEEEEEEQEEEEVEVEVGGVPDIVWEGDDIIVRKRRVNMRRRKGQCLPGEVPGTAVPVPVRVRVAAAVPAGAAGADGGSGTEGGWRVTRTAGDAGTPSLTVQAAASASALTSRRVTSSCTIAQATSHTLPPLFTYPSSQQADSSSCACHAPGVNYYLDQEWDSTHRMHTRPCSGAQEKAQEGEQQEVGWGRAGGEGVGAYEQFYVDLHTEFQNVYVDYMHPAHAASALAAMAGRFYGRHQLACVLVPIDRWRNAICGEYRRKGKRCPRGPSCPFLHPFANPHGDYEWADFDAPPPLLWQQQMQGLYGGGRGARDYEREIEARRERSEGGRERSEGGRERTGGEGKERGVKEGEGVREMAEVVGRGGRDSGGEVRAIVGELGTRIGRTGEGATQKGEGVEGEERSGGGKRGRGGAEGEGRSRVDKGRRAVEGRERGSWGWEERDSRSSESRSDMREGEEREDKEERGEREEREERGKKGKGKEIDEREGQEKRRERKGRSVERGREERACGLRRDGSDGGGSDGRDESGRVRRLSDGEGERWGIQGEGKEGMRKRVDRELEGQRSWKGENEVDWSHGEEGRDSHGWERRAGGQVRRAGVRGGEEARRPDVGRGSAGGMRREERSTGAGKVSERAVLHVVSREGWRDTDGRVKECGSWSAKNEKAKERRICKDGGNNGEWGGAVEVQQGKGEKARGGRHGEGRGVEAEREKELRALLLQRMQGVGGRVAEGRDKKRDARDEGRQVQERAKGQVEEAFSLRRRTIAKGEFDQGSLAASSCFLASGCEGKAVDDDRWEMET